VVPFIFAVFLTVAAGLSLAEEHAWAPSAVARGSGTSSDLSGRSGESAVPDKAMADRDPGSTGGRFYKAATSKSHVGSRALMSHDSREPGAHLPGTAERPTTADEHARP
jgi:hypothetical protein